MDIVGIATAFRFHGHCFSASVVALHQWLLATSSAVVLNILVPLQSQFMPQSYLAFHQSAIRVNIECRIWLLHFRAIGQKCGICVVIGVAVAGTACPIASLN